MPLTAVEIDQIVKTVIDELKRNNIAPQSPGGLTGIFPTLDEAYNAAKESQKQIRNLELRGKIIQAIRTASIKYARELAELAVQETGFGRVEDKIKKNLAQAEKTPGIEDLQPEALSGDHGLTLTEKAPWGVIASVTPSTNPAATVINNGISMIASGNAVVFAPHPAAKNVSQKTISILNEAVRQVGGPAHLLTSVAEPSIEAAQQLFVYPGIDLLVVTGGAGVVNAAMRSGKRAICGGPGNPAGAPGG